MNDLIMVDKFPIALFELLNRKPLAYWMFVMDKPGSGQPLETSEPGHADE